MSNLRFAWFKWSTNPRNRTTPETAVTMTEGASLAGSRVRKTTPPGREKGLMRAHACEAPTDGPVVEQAPRRKAPRAILGTVGPTERARGLSIPRVRGRWSA